MFSACRNSDVKQEDNRRMWYDKAVEAQNIALQKLGAGDTEGAFKYFQQAKEYHIAGGDSLSIVYNLLNIGEIYKTYNDYIELEATSIEALKFVNNPNDTLYNPIIYNNLGSVNRNLMNYKASIENYKKALKLTKGDFRKMIMRNNMANVLIDSTAYSEAREILQEELPVAEESDSYYHSLLLDNLGFTNYKLGNSNGLRQMQQAYALRQVDNDTIGQVTSLVHLAKANVNPNLPLAMEYAVRANELSTAIKSPNDRIKALAIILKNSRNASQIAEASKHYVHLSDSIVTANQRARNAFAAIKYDSKVALEKVAALESAKAIEKLKQQRQWLINILVLLLVIGSSIVLVIWLRSRHKKDKLREEYRVETRIAKKVHDELANDVYHVMTFADTKDLSDVANKEILLDSLDGIYNRTRNISNENSQIDTGVGFVNQLKQMMEQFVSSKGRVIVNISETVDWRNIDDIRKITTYRVIQEFLVNWKKHSNSNLALVKVSQERSIVRIEYSDNGNITTDQTIPKNGLQNVENRILGIGGTVIFDNNPGAGFRVNVEFPI